MLSLQKAHVMTAPNPTVHAYRSVQAQAEQQFSEQRYTENTPSATFSAEPSPLARMISCLAEISSIGAEAKKTPRNSALTLEMLRVFDEAGYTLETLLNDFLTTQDAGLPPLSLGEVRTFLRAEGDSYDEGGCYVANA